MSMNVNDYSQFYKSTAKQYGSASQKGSNTAAKRASGTAGTYSAQTANSRSVTQNHAAENAQANQPQLSDAAQKLLKKLQNTYKNMDFMAYGEEQDPKDLLSHGTKEFSVLFSVEELEKMASDEKYEKEYMDKVQTVLRMTEKINKAYGFTSAFGENADNAQITKIGISFNKDGSVTYFAELEKSSKQQRELMEKGRTKRAEEKKAAEKKEQALKKKGPVKRTTVQAASEDDLMKKISEIDWDKIKEEQDEAGGRLDYSV